MEHSSSTKTISSQGSKTGGETCSAEDANDVELGLIFNDHYEIVRELGHGRTAKVFMCQSLQNPKE